MSREGGEPGVHRFEPVGGPDKLTIVAIVLAVVAVFLCGLLVGRATAAEFPSVTVEPYLHEPDWGRARYAVYVDSAQPWDKVVVMVNTGHYAGTRVGPMMRVACKARGNCPRPQIPCVTRVTTYFHDPIRPWMHMQVYMQCHELHEVPPGAGLAYWFSAWRQPGDELCVMGASLEYRGDTIPVVANLRCPTKVALPTWSLIKEMYR